MVFVDVVISQTPLTSTQEGRRGHQGVSAELCADWLCTLWIEREKWCQYVIFLLQVYSSKEGVAHGA
jgi:hypothetical protein